MFGGIHKSNPMTGVRQKTFARFRRFEDSFLPFDSQIIMNAALICHPAHKTFGLMSIQLISDKNPPGIRTDSGSLSDVTDKILFCPGQTDGRSHDFTGCNHEIGDQAQGSMPDITVFTAFRL